MSAETPVQIQLEAYNARDLQRFVAVYSEDVRVYRLPATEPILAGKAAFTEHYATQRFHLPGLRAEIVRRIVLGNKVIDHERVYGVREQPYEVVAVYEVVDGLILTGLFFSAD